MCVARRGCAERDGYLSSAADANRPVREVVLLGLSAAGSFLLTLVRTKLVALAWGPIGIGSIGMMQAAMATATLVGGVGVDSIITREIAKSRKDDDVRVALLVSAATRGALLLALVAGVLSGLAFFALGDRVSLAAPAAAAVIAAGVMFSILTACLRGALSGLGRLSSVAKVGVVSSLGALAGVSVLAWLPSSPVAAAAAVMVVPLASGLVSAGFLAAARPVVAPGWFEATKEMVALARQSSHFALAGVLPVLGQLLARSAAKDSLGPESFGHFQASMALAATSISVLATSVGPSVLPRLSAAAHSREELSAAVNEQTRVYLVLFAPVALTLALAPELVARLLYSPQFEPVGGQLSWQIIGEVFRLPAWVLATVLTARGRGRAYLGFEAFSLVVLVTATALGARTEQLALIGGALSIGVTAQLLSLVLLVRADGVRLARGLWGRLALLAVALVGLASFRDVLVVQLGGAGVWAVAVWEAARAVAKLRRPRGPAAG